MIEKSVGTGGTNNIKDTLNIQARLFDLGYHFVKVDGDATDPRTNWGIKLFQAIIRGKSRVSGMGVDGRVDPNGTTHQWLMAENAPRWIPLDRGGAGFTNFERQDPNDQHDCCTDWTQDFIKAAGKHYQDNFLAGLPANRRVSPISVNDLSMIIGGTSADHVGHQTGLDIDLRIPRNDGRAGGLRWFSGSDLHPKYDQEAMRAQLAAFKAAGEDMSVSIKLVFFNDESLIAEGLCTQFQGHDDHVHIGLTPPVRVPVADEDALLARLTEVIDTVRPIYG